MGTRKRSGFQYTAEDKKETEKSKKVRRDRTLYYRGDQSSANFDDMLHAKCIDFTTYGDEKATALRVRQDMRP